MKHLNIPLDVDLHKRLKRYCLETDQDMTTLVRRLLAEFLASVETTRSSKPAWERTRHL